MPEREQEPRYTAEVFYRSFRILVTLPYENAGAMTGILDELLEKGCTPTREVVVYEAPQEGQDKPATPAKQEVKETPPGFCPVHNVEMKKFEKNGRSWYSHRQGDGWCNGKTK